MTPRLRFAFPISTSMAQVTKVYFLPGLLANKEAAQRSNPAL
jgi:hypothetical protein